MNKYLLFGGGALALYLLTRQQAAGGPPAPGLSGPPVDTRAAQQLVRQAIEQSGVSTTYIYSQQQPQIWNYYAEQALRWTPPATETLFGPQDAHKPVTFETWWRKLEPHMQAPPATPQPTMRWA